MTSLWNWTSPAWLVAAVILITYSVVFRRALGKRILFLLAGLLALLTAYVSPIGVLADGYLFSAHMMQHLLLLLIVPLCLLLSLPPEPIQAWFRASILNRAGAALTRFPLIGWICGLGAMWLWHAPDLCSASTQSAAVGVFRDATFLLAGLLFWWPIYAPVERFRLGPPQAALYLFSACAGCTLLGVYITFTPVTVCPAFAHGVQRLGIKGLGLTPALDQQWGGLLMWVPPCTLYVSAIISMMRRWYHVPQDVHSIVASQDGMAVK